LISIPKVKKQIGLGDLPEEVRVALIGIMNEMRIYDVEAGLIKMALLANANSKIYKSSLEKEAENRYKSRHFVEMNKTTATLQKAAEARAESEYNRGWAEAYKKYSISYPCNICGVLITLTPNSEVHRAIIGYLREEGWAHAECVNSQG
jgi:hypothetical protein